MPTDRLTPLQRGLLQLLADLVPRWTLVGGAALAGIHLGHRTTRDLDLFWRGQERLGDLVSQITERLRMAGLAIAPLQSTPAFCRLRVSDEKEIVVLDLVADPSLPIDEDQEAELGSSRILVASSHDILVDKLCSLLGRMEVRDLLDVAALVEHGANLERALADAPSKDGGFSLLTLAWLLRSFDPVVLAPASGIDRQTAERLAGFRDELIARLLGLARPG
ncbi:MAG: nucleotidyl transferase AbiEii/AbiGii toxin family protein [Bradymonadales bacterium]|nr:nucleotidyl transferase AbiEii/AbiGii toxin family protein [Bradymonadales bacterium]